jgi:hypothetical protein
MIRQRRNVMTHACSTLLTAVTILAHAVMGCCWHSHSGEAAHCHWSSCGYAHSHDGRTIHSHQVCATDSVPGGPGRMPQSDEPATPVTCEHSVCVYVQTETSLADWQGRCIPAFGWIDYVAAGPAEALSMTAFDRELGRSGDDVPVDAAQLRARLQVWLV